VRRRLLEDEPATWPDEGNVRAKREGDRDRNEQPERATTAKAVEAATNSVDLRSIHVDRDDAEWYEACA
jgi:hypothetical protein